eukprot:GHVU01065415.1.p1 GENE.GHVU01065415.1~~GHVU01065415.1.p1  ORF type:complete len:139 (+),score=0.48 GHVU01065415.1:2474-2890(+)
MRSYDNTSSQYTNKCRHADGTAACWKGNTLLRSRLFLPAIGTVEPHLAFYARRYVRMQGMIGRPFAAHSITPNVTSRMYASSSTIATFRQAPTLEAGLALADMHAYMHTCTEAPPRPGVCLYTTDTTVCIRPTVSSSS